MLSFMVPVQPVPIEGERGLRGSSATLSLSDVVVLNLEF